MEVLEARLRLVEKALRRIDGTAGKILDEAFESSQSQEGDEPMDTTIMKEGELQHTYIIKAQTLTVYAICLQNLWSYLQQQRRAAQTQPTKGIVSASTKLGKQCT